MLADIHKNYNQSLYIRNILIVIGFNHDLIIIGFKMFLFTIYSLQK